MDKDVIKKVVRTHFATIEESATKNGFEVSDKEIGKNQNRMALSLDGGTYRMVIAFVIYDPRKMTNLDALVELCIKVVNEPNEVTSDLSKWLSKEIEKYSTQ